MCKNMTPRVYIICCAPLDINECACGPCMNGGTCNDGIAEFSCICVLGFNGSICETSEYRELSSMIEL